MVDIDQFHNQDRGLEGEDKKEKSLLPGYELQADCSTPNLEVPMAVKGNRRKRDLTLL